MKRSGAGGWWLDLEGAPPPAVVAHLATPGSPAAATGATLLDLAARGYVELRQPAGDPRQTTVHLAARRSVDATALRPYEHRVLERLREVAIGGVAPLSALTFRQADRAAGWAAGFAAEVAAEARALGLTRRRLLLGDRRTPAGHAVVARSRGLRASLRTDEAFAALPPAAVTVWGRHLAYGHALGLTGTCASVIDLGAGERTRNRWGAGAPHPVLAAAVWAALGCAVLRCASAVGALTGAGDLPGRVSAGLQILGAVLLAPACYLAVRATRSRPSTPC